MFTRCLCQKPSLARTSLVRVFAQTTREYNAVCRTFYVVNYTFVIKCGAFVIICCTFVIIWGTFVFICGASVILCGGFVIFYIMCGALFFIITQSAFAGCVLYYDVKTLLSLSRSFWKRCVADKKRKRWKATLIPFPRKHVIEPFIILSRSLKDFPF